MPNIITRKCAKCKGVIEIDVDDINSIIYFNKLYYHKDCFVAMAQQKAASKRGKPQMWQDALDNIWSLEAETKRMLESYAAKDELNEWLLSNYDVSMVPSYFWQLVVDLESGKYKNKKCKPINITTLYSMWRWGQKRLNQIALKNKENKRGPQTDNDRIRYDLSILLSHLEDFKRYQNKVKAERVEAQASAQKENKNIDYKAINKIKEINTKRQEDDISDILDEIFG